jgi:hypothetical protein
MFLDKQHVNIYKKKKIESSEEIFNTQPITADKVAP